MGKKKSKTGRGFKAVGSRKSQDSPTGKKIGQAIMRLRTKKGLTTTELAALVGISQAQISRLENGCQGFRSDTLVRIAVALGVPLEIRLGEVTIPLP